MEDASGRLHARPLRLICVYHQSEMEIKRELTLVENSFHRSGNHQGDYQSKIGIESWVVDFAGDLFTKYAIIVLEQGLLSSLGKAMEFGTGRDTGVLVGTSAAAEALGLTTNLVAEGKNGQLIKDSSAERKRRRHQQREGENNEGQELSKKRKATHEMLSVTETGFTQASEDFNPQRMMAHLKSCSKIAKANTLQWPKKLWQVWHSAAMKWWSQ